jgi:mannose-1-phosphate guanylyltransferase
VEYGWIEPGERLSDETTHPIHAVRNFWEKPSVDRAQSCLAAGHLWNTSVLVGKVAQLLHAGWQAAPEMSERVARLEPFSGTEDEPGATRQAYELMEKANFSRAVLEALPDALAVSVLPSVAWSDLGTPHRLFEVAARMKTPPAWAEALLPHD